MLTYAKAGSLPILDRSYTSLIHCVLTLLEKKQSNDFQTTEDYVVCIFHLFGQWTHAPTMPMWHVDWCMNTGFVILHSSEFQTEKILSHRNGIGFEVLTVNFHFNLSSVLFSIPSTNQCTFCDFFFILNISLYYYTLDIINTLFN